MVQGDIFTMMAKYMKSAAAARIAANSHLFMVVAVLSPYRTS
jgi:hypothetical protein